MSNKVDRRVRKTRAQLRAGLARLMQKKSMKEITVKELVEEVDINRSTFYLHYTDIYQMLESIEQELMDEISETMRTYPPDPMGKDGSYLFITQIFMILEENRDICCALLGPNGDIAFVNRIEKIIAKTVLDRLGNIFPKNIRDVEYAYTFCLTGCVGMIKSWLNDQHSDSPQHMAELTYQFIANTAHLYLNQSFKTN